MALSPSSVGVFSSWFRLDDDTAFFRALFGITGPSLEFSMGFYSNSYRVKLLITSPFFQGFDIITSSFVEAAPTSDLSNLLVSWDMTGISPVVQMYLNDIPDINVLFSFGSGVLFPWQFIDTIRAFAEVPSIQATSVWNGCCAQIYLNTEEYLDFDNVTNRRKFIDAAGDMVSLGANGEVPTGTSPSYYFTGNSVTFPTNQGMEQAVTLFGTFVDCPPIPGSVFTSGGGGYLTSL